MSAGNFPEGQSRQVKVETDEVKEAGAVARLRDNHDIDDTIAWKVKAETM